MALERTIEALNERRRIAVRMFERNLDVHDIATLLDCHPQTIRTWRRVYHDGGWDALRAKPHLGPTCKLNDQQKQTLITWLAQSPTDFHDDATLWTTKLIARLIHDQLGVDYSHNHVGVILHEPGYSWQMPAKQARERDEQKITQWREQTWPQIVAESKKRGSTLAFIDEAGYSMIPTLKKQWAPKGQTPVVRHRNRWHRKINVIGALCVNASGDPPSLSLQWHPDEHVDQTKVAMFLNALIKEHDANLDVIWDNLSSHGGPMVRKVLEHHPQLRLHRLPAYAPDLNPIEGVWSLTKYHRMANHDIDDLDTLQATALAAIADVAAQPQLLHACIKHAGLQNALSPPRNQ